MSRSYEPLEFVSMQWALSEIASGDPVRVAEATLSAALKGPDRQQTDACAVALTLFRLDDRRRRERRVGTVPRMVMAKVGSGPFAGRLVGKVAVVTGASRGIGKGIAAELGAAGVTETEALGGTGIALRCDHHADDEVRAVFERVEREAGRLDVLVNNVFSVPGLAPWIGRPFWEVPIELWDEIIGVGARSHYVASALAAPLLIRTGAG